MPYVAIHQKQLGRGVPVPGRMRGSVDCGPRSWQMVADQQTRGRRRPGVRILRRRSGTSGPEPTSLRDARQALHGLAVPGRTPLRFYVKRSVPELRQAVRRGRPAVVAIAYWKLNQLQRETGDPAFVGAHSVAVLAQRSRGAGVEWLLADPLDDGRRRGIARGARWVPRWHVIAAALALVGGRRDAIWAGVAGGSHAR